MCSNNGPMSFPNSARSVILAFSNAGRSMERECAQNAPSVVKMPRPRSGPTNSMRSELDQSLDFVEAAHLMFLGIISEDNLLREAQGQ